MNQSDTQARASTNWSGWDTPILIASAISALVFIFLLARPQHFTNPGLKNIAAVLREGHNVVRIRPQQDWAWVEGEAGSNLHSGDLIFTYEQSSAKIDFSWGGELLLASNTLIQITSPVSPGQSGEITLKQGQIDANLNQGGDKLRLNYQGKSMSLEAATAKNTKVQFKAEGKAGKLYILDGEAKLHGHENLTKGKILSIAQDGSSKVEQLPFTYEGPQHESFHPASSPIVLSWKRLNGFAGPLMLKIAADERMKHLLLKQELHQESYTFTAPHEGVFFWQLAGLNGPKGAILQFSTADLSAPKVSLLSEQKKLVQGNQILLSVKDAAANKIVHWEWLRPDGETEFHEQISSGMGTISLAKVQAGKHEIRVRNEFQGHFSPWSELIFEIAPQPPLNFPKILYPLDGQLEFFFHDQQNSPHPVMAIRLEDMGEVLYHISLQNLNTGQSETVTSETPTLSVTPKGFGTFLLKARSTSSDSVSPWSTETKFSIREMPRPASAPEHGTKIELEKPSEKVTFSWQAPPLEEQIESAPALSYLFEMDDSPDFDSPSISTVVTNTTFSNAVERPGTYYWRIKIQTTSGEVLYSKPRKVEISPIPPPVAPEIKDLDLKIKWKESSSSWREYMNRLWALLLDSAMAARPHVEIEWLEVKNSKLYHIQIFDESKALLFETKTQKTQLEWVPPAVGKYFWRMAIIDWWDRPGPFSDFAQLDIAYEDEDINLPAPLIPNAEIEVQDQKALLFEWDHAYQGSLSLWLQITTGKSEKKFLRPEFEIEVSGKSHSIPIEKLAFFKKHYWRLAFLSPDKTIIKSSEIKSFKLTLPKKEENKPLAQTKLEEAPVLAEVAPIAPARFSVQFAYAPTLLEMQTSKNSWQTQVDGMTFTNFRLGLGDRAANYLWATPDLSATLLFERGVVFTTQTYTRLFLAAQAYYDLGFSSIFLGPYLGVGQLQQFENSNGTVQSSSANLALVGLAAKKVFENILLKLDIALGLGLQLNMEGSYQLPEAWGQLASRLEFGVGFEKLTVESSGLETDYQAIRPFVQYQQGW